jgi:hypothetical protein
MVRIDSRFRDLAIGWIVHNVTASASAEAASGAAMNGPAGPVFPFDGDNTLLDNDAEEADLRACLGRGHGAASRTRYPRGNREADRIGEVLG